MRNLVAPTTTPTSSALADLIFISESRQPKEQKMALWRAANTNTLPLELEVGGGGQARLG